MLINPNLADTGTPPIPEVQAWATRYGGQRGPLIDMAQAVPGYPPHPDMLDRLGQAAASPVAAQYGPILGDVELRRVYAGHVSTLYGAPIEPHEVAITAGCNQAFFVTMAALARPGDAVLLPSPWYFNHKMTLDMLGIEARALECRREAGFVPDAEEAERLIDFHVRAIVLVSPNNPAGAVYPPSVIARFSELCRRRGLALILDETYRDFRGDGAAAPHALFRQPDWQDHLVQLYSFSKAYCIPGHRTGAIVMGGRLAAELAKVLDCVQICAPRPAQTALAWAIPALEAWRDANRGEIASRSDAFRRALAQAPEWRIEAIGAYFAYVRHPFEGRAGTEVAAALAAERGVLCLPGSYFGGGQEPYLRLAFANAGASAIEDLSDRLRSFALPS